MNIGNELMERYELAINRIRQINSEYFKEINKESFGLYYHEVTKFIIILDDVYKSIKDDNIKRMNSEKLARDNKELYIGIYKDNYKTSFANPDYAYSQFKMEFDESQAVVFAKLFSALYAQMRACIGFVYEGRLDDVIISLELFIEVYGIVAQDIDDDANCVRKAVKDAMYYFIYDYADEYMERQVGISVDENNDFITKIVMESNLTNTDYLYYYGEYIGENELGISRYLATFSQEKIDSMAATYVEGYAEGFSYAGIDLSTKKTVNIRYNIGFERIIRSAITMFEQRGLKPVIYMASGGIAKASPRKIGVCSCGVNKQYDYDHRYDFMYFANKSLMDRYLVCTRLAYEKFSEKASVYAGPAVMEIFGEKPFVPVNSDNAISPDKKAMKLLTAYNQERNLLVDEFVNLSQTSFTIIAYPVPEIGDEFKNIFDETVKINTLDKVLYRQMQEKIIEVLNKGKCVHIYGMNGNKTDLTISLMKLNDERNETIFENCLADVNIPVGEVFTSPKLKGTSGVLNVSKVYLNGLEYRNLYVYFKDGMIDDYSCDNFGDSNQGRKYIEENIMFGHDSLPMGEFAIGTNTTAYVMGRKYNISDKLPILIAEKTGPHFALGDTCYSMSEDNRVYNPDGKEIIAKDNEVSILRKTDIEKAYFNCHTDITIPYDELGLIEVEDYQGNFVRIIENGRFVLEGTEKLNEPLDAMLN